MEKKNAMQTTEKCVLCGMNTGVPFSTPIEQRTNYIEGCGQLCARCHRSIERESMFLSHKNI